jgi:hypothetical protein
MAGWQLNPKSTEDWENEDYVADDGEHIAMVETFSYGSYPHARDPATGEWRRGGCFESVVEAKAWAERIAGVHPRKPGEFEGQPSSPIAGPLSDPFNE